MVWQVLPCPIVQLAVPNLFLNDLEAKGRPVTVRGRFSGVPVQHLAVNKWLKDQLLVANFVPKVFPPNCRSNRKRNCLPWENTEFLLTAGRLQIPSDYRKALLHLLYNWPQREIWHNKIQHGWCAACISQRKFNRNGAGVDKTNFVYDFSPHDGQPRPLIRYGRISGPFHFIGAPLGFIGGSLRGPQSEKYQEHAKGSNPGLKDGGAKQPSRPSGGALLSRENIGGVFLLLGGLIVGVLGLKRGGDTLGDAINWGGGAWGAVAGWALLGWGALWIATGVVVFWIGGGHLP